MVAIPTITMVKIVWPGFDVCICDIMAGLFKYVLNVLENVKTPSLYGDRVST